LKSTCKNSGTFEGKKILPEKVTYVPLAPSHSIIDIVSIGQSGVQNGFMTLNHIPNQGLFPGKSPQNKVSQLLDL